MSSFFAGDEISAIRAKSIAQGIAFGPFSFYAVLAMRDLGIISKLDEAQPGGLSCTDLAESTGLSKYSVSILLDFAKHLDIVSVAGDKWTLGRVGYFFIHDEMTRVNMNFTRDVCYQGLRYLPESINNNMPEGLKTLGNWDTIYEGLPELQEPTKSSWYEFNHYYSDSAFNSMLPHVFDRQVNHIVDIGGNTGRWALHCLNHDPNVKVTIIDLINQTEDTLRDLDREKLERLSCFTHNIIDDINELPASGDVIWMSQFLDCFDPEQIVEILRKAKAAMDESARLFIIDAFPDLQKLETSSFCLSATSLYFTCIANGRSRMYNYEDFIGYIDQAGLTIEKEWHNVGICHTAICCTSQK
ncbi:methyltransferase [Halorhodospira halochloris]|uniref:methyltransferase n=1 Tax=Halorhodospira halochloris TaxID=1052 RepID=UPI001EE7B6D0|nr:methyltransferase [Halorhodospira halochloris]MCG5529922.1 methyltransferase [Halorhodospira halochloris]